MENKTAHLEMIQNVINRMSVNSFLLKGWSVVLVTGLFAIGASQGAARFVYLAYFPAISFWALDGYFIHQERLFRSLYDRIRVMEDHEIDFSMDTRAAANRYNSWRASIFSKTLLIFHGSVLLTMVVVTWIVSREFCF